MRMRTKKEVEDMYKDLKEIQIAIHPSLIFFVEWVLKRRSRKAKFFAQDMKALADTHRKKNV